ncbi:MAG: zf-HC2 domain-containing protein [Deltaproteobacteria bacterium]|nr:zf-HC2 domain-containing protein [Deltaproteobacteria bacterium]
MQQRTVDLLPKPGCREVTPHQLRRYAAGELDPTAAERVARHLEQCLDCAAIVAEIRSDQAAFCTVMPFERFAADHERRLATHRPLTGLARWWRSLRWPAALTAAAAATALVALWVVSGPDDGVRLKGGQATIGFLVKQGDQIRRGSDGEPLTAGDRIQFLVRADARARAMVLVGIDGRGAVTVYGAESLTEQTKGEPEVRLLPESVILDDAIGPERFFAVFSSDLGPEALHARVQVAAQELARSGVDLSRVEALPLDDEAVTQASISIVKVTR